MLNGYYSVARKQQRARNTRPLSPRTLNVRTKRRPNSAFNTLARRDCGLSMKKRDQLDPSDILYFPATIVLSYILSRWLPGVAASALAVVLTLSAAYFIARVRGSNTRSFFLAVLAAGIVTFLLRLVGWSE